MARSEHRVRPRRPLIALAVAVTLVLSACAGEGFTTAQRTNHGDGARADLGTQIGVENLLLLTEEEGAPGQLVGGAVNHWSQGTDVSFTAAGVEETVTVSVGAGETVLLHPDHQSIVLPAVPSAPGTNLEFQISTPEAGSVTVPVPVLDGTIDPYQDYLPTAGD